MDTDKRVVSRRSCVYTVLDKGRAGHERRVDPRGHLDAAWQSMAHGVVFFFFFSRPLPFGLVYRLVQSKHRGSVMPLGPFDDCVVDKLCIQKGGFQGNIDPRLLLHMNFERGMG